MKTLIIINSIPGSGANYLSSLFNNTGIHVDSTLSPINTRDDIELLELEKNSKLMVVYPPLNTNQEKVIKKIISEHNNVICLNLIKENIIDSLISYYIVKQLYNSNYNIGVTKYSKDIPSQEWYDKLQYEIIEKFDFDNFIKYIHIYEKLYAAAKKEYINSYLYIVMTCNKNNVGFCKYDLSYDYITKNKNMCYTYLHKATGFEINTINIFKDSDSLIIKHIKKICEQKSFDLSKFDYINK